MSRTKKSRSAGSSSPKFDGSRKETSSQAQKARDKKRKDKLKGNKAGNRNTVETKQGAQQSQRQAKNDKRVGSKAPILLTPNEQPKETPKPKVVMEPKVKVIKTQAIPKLSPEKELDEIENDDRLNDLLEQAENNKPLSKEDQAWVDKKMKRHQELMKELGWIDEDGEEDLLQQFEDAGSVLDQYR
ncbi:Der GTPase-activating protein YihI [Psychromonas sp.]|nr:Der GTPase-activating protein YihI [Psychromonas sp.]